jgi:hypothetical protein
MYLSREMPVTVVGPVPSPGARENSRHVARMTPHRPSQMKAKGTPTILIDAFYAMQNETRCLKMPCVNTRENLPMLQTRRPDRRRGLSLKELCELS